MRGWPLAKTAEAQENDYSDYVMLALRPPEPLRRIYADMSECTEDVDELHITLLYLGTTEDAGGDWGRERLYRACYHVALDQRDPLVGQFNGFGWFLNDDSDVLVALCDAPYLGTFRETLRRRCLLHGVPLRQENHGFTPHMTLSYQDRTNGKIPQIPRGGREEVKYESFYLVWGQDWQEITFS